MTRVTSEFLEALEVGRWEDIPQPYLRGYLYLYAQAVGMNVDKVLQSFDRMIAAPDDEDPATLDSSAPLLRQPEHIGVTRAKIRTGWFKALTQNRKTAYLALVAAVAILGTGLYLSRRAQRPHISVSPFEQTVAEYRQTLRGPMTHLDFSASDSSALKSRRVAKRVLIVGLQRGTVLIPQKDQKPRAVQFGTYDTLAISYDTLVYIEIVPTVSARVSQLGADSLRPDSIFLDTAYYALSEKKHLLSADSEEPEGVP